MYFLRSAALACLGATLGAAMSPAFAGPIPYPNAGTENPVVYRFTATTTGDLTAYFYGSGAGYDETLGLLINGKDSGINGLDDHSSPLGDSLDFGQVTAGDTLTFYITLNAFGNTYQLYSNPLRNPGFSNQVYSTSYDGTGGPAGIPAGTYVGFEDQDPFQVGGTDYNYTDEQFVFTNTSTMSSVPLPATAPMFGAALVALGVAGYGLKRKAKAAA